MHTKEFKSAASLSRPKTAVLVVLISFAVLLLTEVGARVIFAAKTNSNVLFYGTPLYRVAPRPAHTVIDHANEVAGYSKYFPNEVKYDHAPDVGEEFEVRINSSGFRGEDFSLEKEPGTIRVVTLGASSTFGYHDRDNETYPYLLERELTEMGGGRKFEVLNLAIPHLRSWEILALFKAEALPLRPDVVTFYEAINDSVTEAAEPVGQQEREQIIAVRDRVAGWSPIRTIYRELRDRFVILGLVDSLLQTQAIWSFTEADYTKHVAGRSQRFLDNIAAINELCKENGILFIVMKQQAKSQMIADVSSLTYEEEFEIVRNMLLDGERVSLSGLAFLTHKTLTDDLGAWAETNDVPMVDVIDLLNQDRDLLWTWVHLHPKANAMIAKALSSEILIGLN